MNDISVSTHEDQRLVVSVKQGSVQAFEKLYDKYAPALLGIIKRIVNNENQADEILKSTFVKIWEQAAAYDASQISLFTWLINLARQTAVEEIKPAQVKNLQPYKPVYDDKKAEINNNSYITGQDQRSAFDLLFYAGLSCKEAAEQLHITVAELKNNIRMKIKKLL